MVFDKLESINRVVVSCDQALGISKNQKEPISALRIGIGDDPV